jgi:cobalt/nickel transport system ATP-binding protein
MLRETVSLTLRHLIFSYRENSAVLQGIDLDVITGEKVGLIGPNGAGKTTLFLTICGVLKPKNGEIYLFNQPVEAGKFYPEIGLIFQNPDDQLFSPSVKDDLVFGLENLGLSPPEIESRLAAVIPSLDLENLLERVPHELSGGEKCRVAIAAVLVMQPQLILYDEPSANLDLYARRNLINFLQKCSQTLLIASHDLELILEVCDRVVLLNQGHLVADGLPEQILGDKILMEKNRLEVPLSLRS